ncbi:MAG: TonB-dependent receptor [Deltaproteobacteria bacterium]|nr:TonB-dependent receptor [Deltaproteobacteria bacterium]
MNRWKRVCLTSGIGIFIAAFLFPVWVSAVEKDETIHRLDEVVVSTSRTEISVSDAPQSVTVLSSEEIMASPHQRVEDIVRSMAGIYNFRHYSQQSNGIVSPLIIRGVGKNRVLVLVDGVPQNDNFNNSIAWVAWGHIPKETIERIEIVRGPTSALYGSEGLGGVIHIITKKPRTRRKTSIRADVGTADTYGGFGFHSQKIKDFGFMLAGGYEESDGFYMTDHPETYNIKRYRDVGKVFGKATYDLNASSDLSFTALYYDHETGKGRKFFYDELELDQYWLNYSYEGEHFGLKGLVYLNRADKTAYQDTSKDFYTSLLRKEEAPSKTWGADFQGTIPFQCGANLVLGAAFKESTWDYDNEYVESTRDAGAEGKQRFISPFANMDLRFFDNSLIVNLGARYDWIETSDGANWDSQAGAGRPAYDNEYGTDTEGSFSPKLGIAYHLDDKTTLRASGGKGFRAPSLFELYKVHVRGGGTYYREANPDLKPEEIWSYDVGAERFLLDNLLGKLTFYQSFAEDYIGDRLIGTGTISGGKTRYDYKLDNISEVDIYGIETELQWYPASELTFFANYTYNISEVDKDENNADLEGNYLPNNPRHNLHFGGRYQNPKIVDVSLTANYYADIYYDNENTLKAGDYWTVDVAVSRRFFDRLTVYVNAENIFDEEYAISKTQGRADTIAPGAIVTGGVKFEF